MNNENPPRKTWCSRPDLYDAGKCNWPRCGCSDDGPTDAKITTTEAAVRLAVAAKDLEQAAAEHASHMQDKDAEIERLTRLLESFGSIESQVAHAAKMEALQDLVAQMHGAILVGQDAIHGEFCSYFCCPGCGIIADALAAHDKLMGVKP